MHYRLLKLKKKKEVVNVLGCICALVFKNYASIHIDF